MPQRRLMARAVELSRAVAPAAGDAVGERRDRGGGPSATGPPGGRVAADWHAPGWRPGRWRPLNPGAHWAGLIDVGDDGTWWLWRSRGPGPRGPGPVGGAPVGRSQPGPWNCGPATSSPAGPRARGPTPELNQRDKAVADWSDVLLRSGRKPGTPGTSGPSRAAAHRNRSPPTWPASWKLGVDQPEVHYHRGVALAATARLGAGRSPSWAGPWS